MKNTRGKTVSRADAYEVWRSHDGSWTWYVLKAWQGDDDKPFARWFCDVVTPMCPNGEKGDVYVAEVKANARRIDGNAPKVQTCRHPVIHINIGVKDSDSSATLGKCMACGELVAL